MLIDTINQFVYAVGQEAKILGFGKPDLDYLGRQILLIKDSIRENESKIKTYDYGYAVAMKAAVAAASSPILSEDILNGTGQIDSERKRVFFARTLLTKRLGRLEHLAKTYYERTFR